MVPQLPSGGGANGGYVFAQTLDDYRALYQTFLSDPDYMAVRAKYPCIHTWDDHEFTNDCWQSMANYDNHFSLDEPSQARRYACSQAWFEYIPAMLSGVGEAMDFTPVDGGVMDAPFTDQTRTTSSRSRTTSPRSARSRSIATSGGARTSTSSSPTCARTAATTRSSRKKRRRRCSSILATCCRRTWC